MLVEAWSARLIRPHSSRLKAAHLYGVEQLGEQSYCLEAWDVAAAETRKVRDVRKLLFAGSVRILQAAANAIAQHTHGLLMACSETVQALS
jgi:hypothetical protein